MRRSDIRNIAIIAHVDHGKTTLVDCLLRQSGEFRASQLVGDCILDSNDLERERGITILAKNIAIHYKGVKINLIDTPGHADFGGEVERVLRMADGALVLVDAAEGPMPQTRYVLSKALECGLQPIVVINKIDRPDARPHEVLDEAFDLLMDLGAEHVSTTSRTSSPPASEGYATHDPDKPRRLDAAAVRHDARSRSPAPRSIRTRRCKCSSPISIGPTTSAASPSAAFTPARSSPGQQIALMQADDESTLVKVAEVHLFDKLGRVQVEEATAGDIAALVGLEDVDDRRHGQRPRASAAHCRACTVDEPTISDGLQHQQLAVRRPRRQVRHQPAPAPSGCKRELERNVALRVEPADCGDAFQVFGRGVLHLSVLIETMRREGYELSIGKPHVVLHKNDGVIEEPFESLVVEVPHDKLGPVMELVGARRGQLVEMTAHDNYTYVVLLDSRPAA